MPWYGLWKKTSVFFGYSPIPRKPTVSFVRTGFLKQFMAAGGALYQGIMPGRSNDGLAFVAAYASYSDRLSDITGELLLEVNYRVTIAPWLWIEPDLQGIIRPSGSSKISDALVTGLAVGFVL